MADNKRELFSQFVQGVAQQGTPKRDPFGDNRGNLFDAVLSSTPEDAANDKNRYDNPTPILLPRTTTAPEGAETIDIRRIAVLDPGETFTLIEFQCIPGTTTVFFGYGLYTDALDNADVLWLPTIDSRRILAYHGDPNDNFKINLALGIDLSQANLIPCQIFMQPGQIIRWQVTNTGASQASMGVRMSGYLDVGQRLTSSKIGG